MTTKQSRLGFEALHRDADELINLYNQERNKASFESDSFERDVASLRAIIYRGIILARMLHLKPPFEKDEVVYVDEVTSAHYCSYEVTPKQIGQAIRIFDITYDLELGWLIMSHSYSSFELYRAEDFRKENHLSRHALSSDGFPLSRT